MAFELDRALRKSDVLIEENLRLQKQLFDLRRKVK
jgi:hypothetical protein